LEGVVDVEVSRCGTMHLNSFCLIGRKARRYKEGQGVGSFYRQQQRCRVFSSSKLKPDTHVCFHNKDQNNFGENGQ
jgi:hypothetical protein